MDSKQIHDYHLDLVFRYNVDKIEWTETEKDEMLQLPAREESRINIRKYQDRQARIVDDVAFGGENPDECLDVFEEGLIRAERHNVSFAGEKIRLLVRTKKYVGKGLVGNKVVVRKDRMRVLKDLPIPRTAKQMRGALAF